MKKTLKRLIAISMVITMSIGCFPFNAQATSALHDDMELVSENIEYLENEITLITTIHEQASHTTGISTRATTYSKTGTKTQTGMNGSMVLYSLSVTGTFTVNPGVSATCTESSYGYTINDSAWALDSASASRSGNKATASGTFKRTLLLITVETVTLNPVLSCDVNGNLS